MRCRNINTFKKKIKKNEIILNKTKLTIHYYKGDD